MKQELIGVEMATWHVVQKQEIKTGDSNFFTILAALSRRPNVAKVSIHSTYIAELKAYRMSRASKDKLSKRISLSSY